MNTLVADTLTSYLTATAPPGLTAAYLFGSEAAGRAHKESDVDIGLLLDREHFGDRDSRAEIRIRLGTDLIHALHRNELDVVVLNDAPPELGRAIVTSGVRVYCTDPEGAHAYVRDVQLRAADLAPFLRRMRAIKLQRLLA